MATSKDSAGQKFMRWAVGPRTPTRIGGVFGFVAGVALTLFGGYLWYGEIGNLFPMIALAFGGSSGALIGAWIGWMIKRRAQRRGGGG